MVRGDGWFIDITTGDEVRVEDHAVDASANPSRFRLRSSDLAGLHPRHPEGRVKVLQRVLRKGFVRAREEAQRVVFEFDWPDVERALSVIVASALAHGHADAPMLAVEVHDVWQGVNHLVRGADLQDAAIVARLAAEVADTERQSLVICDRAEEGWSGLRLRADTFAALRGHFQRLDDTCKACEKWREAEDECGEERPIERPRGPFPYAPRRGGFIVFRQPVEEFEGSARTPFRRVVDWLRGAAPDMIGGIGEYMRRLAWSQAASLDGLVATTLRLREAVRLGMMDLPESAEWTDPESGETFDRGSLTIWIAGLSLKELQTVARALAREFHQRALMYVLLDERREYYMPSD